MSTFSSCQSQLTLPLCYSALHIPFWGLHTSRFGYKCLLTATMGPQSTSLQSPGHKAERKDLQWKENFLPVYLLLSPRMVFFCLLSRHMILQWALEKKVIVGRWSSLLVRYRSSSLSSKVTWWAGWSLKSWFLAFQKFSYSWEALSFSTDLLKNNNKQTEEINGLLE